MTFNVIACFLCLSVAIGKAINDGLPKCNSDNMHTLIAIWSWMPVSKST